jgi:hypothetical protein
MFSVKRLPDPLRFYESEGLKLVGAGPWRTTRCVFHGGSDSMRINVQHGGFKCMACGVSGGGVLDYAMRAHDLDFIAAAVRLGCWDEDAESTRQSASTRSTTLSPRRAMALMAQEARTLLMAFNDLKNQQPLSAADWQRALKACARIEALAEEFAE